MHAGLRVGGVGHEERAIFATEEACCVEGFELFTFAFVKTLSEVNERWHVGVARAEDARTTRVLQQAPGWRKERGVDLRTQLVEPLIRSAYESPLPPARSISLADIKCRRIP